jgi:hypothetical protein
MIQKYYLTEVKQWYQSKTIWINVVALLALIAQIRTGFVISPTEQIAIITVINLMLRAITGSGLEIAGHNLVKQKIHNVCCNMSSIDHDKMMSDEKIE